MKRLIVNLCSYGDFDIPQTIVVMIAPENMDAGTVKMIAKQIEAENDRSRNPEKAIKAFKDAGFSMTKEIVCTIGGDL